MTGGPGQPLLQIDERGNEPWDLSKLRLGQPAACWPTSGRNSSTAKPYPADVLAVKGKKKATGRSSNTKGDDNIITNGSVIAVADGQCMLIVEQGKVVDMCAEPGEYTYDTSTEPSLFYR